MKEYLKIEGYYEPIQLLEDIGCEDEAQMKKSEQAFLCGLIKKYAPEKILEVGIAAGATSLVLLNAIKKLGLSSKMYSVDLSEMYYMDNTKNTGFLLKEAASYGLDLTNHSLLLGKVAAARMEGIGEGIDFLILDTTHQLPGEVLEFLALLPYLTKDAVVVVHDTAHHFYTPNGYASSVLFHSVVADKFLNNANGYVNIAAFRLNEDTRKYIADVFAGLFMPWTYLPSEDDFSHYEKLLRSNYSEEQFKLYCQAKYKNAMYVLGVNAMVELKDVLNMEKGLKVLLYGTKEQGKRCLYYCQRNGIFPKGFVVSDGWQEDTECEGLQVYEYSKIPYRREEVLILLVNSAKEPEEILKLSEYKWIKVSGLL